MRGAAAATVLLAATLAPAGAFAMPMFARKYDVACGTCHARAYPELNAFGRQFKENGYQLPAGAEEAASVRAQTAPGTPEEPLRVFREAPLALRVTSTVVVPEHPQAAAMPSADFRMVDNLYLLGGGSVYPDVSLVAAASVAPQAVLHHASLGWHNVLSSDGHLNLRVGQLLVLDFLRPVHRTLTKMGNPGALVAVGANPTLLDSTQGGLDAFGRLWRRRIFYRAAILQGATRDGITDLDSNKDFFGELQGTLHDGQTVGLLGYLGRTQITDNTRGVSARYTDRFWIAGADAELEAGPVTFFGYYLRSRHDDPKGLGLPVSYWAARAEADGSLGRRWLAIVRWDKVHDAVETALDREFVSGHVTFMALANLKLAAELDWARHDSRQTLAYFRIDVAL